MDQTLSAELADLLNIPRLQKLMEEFYALAHIPMSILDLKGKVLVGVGWQEICTRFHRVNSLTAQHCLESDTELSAGVVTGSYRLYKCKNNLWDVATPIMIGGQKMGNIFSGQFFFDDEVPDRESFRAQARQYGFDEAGYLAALDRVPRLSRQALENGMRFFVTLADTLSEMGLSNLRQSRLLAERERLTGSLERSQEIAHLGSWELDLETNRLTWSDEVYRIFGLRPQEFGATYEAFLEYVHPEDRAAVHRAYEASIRNNRDIYEIDHRIVRKGTGEVRYVHERCEHVRDASGVIVRSVGMVHDITERKADEEAVASVARFPDENPYPVLRIDSAGTLLYANPAAGGILLSFGSAPGRPAPEPFAGAARRAFKSTGGDLFDFPHGQSVYSFFVIPIAGQGYVNLYGRDVTEQRRAEAALRALTAGLEQRVEERTRQLEAANRDLESFSYTVAHDLKAPLRVINGFSGVLIQEGVEHLTPKQRRALEVIDESAQKMSRLTDALLQFSRLSTKDVQWTSVQTRSVVEEVIQEQRRAIGDEAGGRVQVELGELPTVQGDPLLLRQVFANLLSNAFKFTRTRPHPVVRIHGRSESGKALFIVSDNGVGFPTKQAEQLFQVFQRLHSPAEFEGNGIGLASVKKIIERHGGEVRAEAEEGKGASFIFTLPLLA
ncbi:MAG TPA: PocR ligand-binding domain-containing protein [Bacteroidota bacterium]